MTDQRTRDKLCEIHGLLNDLKGIITGDIGPLVFGVVIKSVESLRDAIPTDDDAMKPFGKGRET